ALGPRLRVAGQVRIGRITLNPAPLFVGVLQADDPKVSWQRRIADFPERGRAPDPSAVARNAAIKVRLRLAPGTIACPAAYRRPPRGESERHAPCRTGREEL